MVYLDGRVLSELRQVGLRSSCGHRTLGGCGKDERKKFKGSRDPNWSLNEEEHFRRKHLVPQEKAGLGRKKFVDTQGLWTTGLLVPGREDTQGTRDKVQASH